MVENSKIAWTDHTFNPWIGCTKISAGCTNCYAEELMDSRYHRVTWGPKGERSRTSISNWNEPRRWDRKAAESGRPARVFCASLADVFDDHPSIKREWRDDLWRLIHQTPNLIWLLLTKRPENWPRYLPTAEPEPHFTNIRLGVTIENMEAFDRLAEFAVAASSVFGWPTFISYEPAIGPVDWNLLPHGHGIEQIICGAESGRDRRPFDEDWARSTRDYCDLNGMSFFYKQKIDSSGRKIEMPVLDGEVYAQVPR